MNKIGFLFECILVSNEQERSQYHVHATFSDFLKYIIKKYMINNNIYQPFTINIDQFRSQSIITIWF